MRRNALLLTGVMSIRTVGRPSLTVPVPGPVQVQDAFECPAARRAAVTLRVPIAFATSTRVRRLQVAGGSADAVDADARAAASARRAMARIPGS